MSRLVFVESNTTGTGGLAVSRLLAAGQRVAFVTRTPAKYPFLASPAPGLELLEADTNDPQALRRALAALRASGPIDALLTTSEFYVPAAAELARELGLPGLDPQAARVCRDKHRTRQALRSAGLLTPEFHLLLSPAEARALAERITYPCVVKPPSDSSSHGVRLVHDRQELLAHHARLAAVTHNVRGQRLDGSVLVESLLSGPEYSVETFSLAGRGTRVIGVTDKHLSAPPLFVETGHDFPSGAPRARREALEHAVLRALEVVGFDFGPAHTEVRFTPDGPVVVEINPRLAGGMIPEAVGHALGIDLLQAWFDAALGRRPDLEPRRAEHASIRFLLADESGRLGGVSGLEAARARPGVREVTLTREPGARVRPAEDAYDRLGFVLAAGPEGAAVARAAQAGAADVRFEIEPECERVA